MALFINVDPVPARWWKRKVYRGWQFGYSGGTQNDFMLDVEVALWRLVCYIGFKSPQNPSSRQERHEKWRKDQERARKRTHKPESAVKQFFRRWRNKTASDRVGPERTEVNQASANAGQLMDSGDQLRLSEFALDRDNEGRSQLATRPGIPEPIPGDADSSLEGKLLRQEHQGPSSHNDDQKEPEAGRLPEESKP